jgi:hypothetical protein
MILSVGPRGGGRPGRPVPRPRRPRARSTPRSQARRPAPPRPQGAAGAVSPSLERSFPKSNLAVYSPEHRFERGCGVGPHCSFCGTFTGPFSEVEGLFTVLICIPCLEVRQAQPGTLLGLHDPGHPWLKWGCPIDGCGQWFIGPWHLEWHTAAEHPGWTATTSCCDRIRTSACGSSTVRSRIGRPPDPLPSAAPPAYLKPGVCRRSPPAGDRWHRRQPVPAARFTAVLPRGSGGDIRRSPPAPAGGWGPSGRIGVRGVRRPRGGSPGTGGRSGRWRCRSGARLPTACDPSAALPRPAPSRPERAWPFASPAATTDQPKSAAHHVGYPETGERPRPVVGDRGRPHLHGHA